MTTSGPGTPGLRERKKAKTRWAIQEHALRLFAEQGYEATTIDQIAAAAEISPSTFFRYFRTKEDVVVQDEFDEQMLDAFRLAGRSDHPIGTLRGLMLQALTEIDPHELVKSRQRTALILTEPALRARAVDNMVSAFDDAAKGFAEGRDRDPDDPAVRAFVGAVIGAIMPIVIRWASTGYTEDIGQLLDRTLQGLQEIVSWG
ncbi:MAG TPA: TetR family transcriptional regulator [Kineosporiaceae bacterium]